MICSLGLDGRTGGASEAACAAGETMSPDAHRARAAVTIDPDSGPEAGGTSVTITGWCFTGATAVLFGGVAATSFTVVDDSTITAVAPAGVGTVDVTVVGSATCGTGELTDGFEYVPAAVIVTPAAAANAGGDLASTGFNGTLAAGFSVLVLLLGAALLTIRGRKLHLLS
ncbi:IPT/TIG domain-containing protein [Cryobacterium sp. PH29-G1]|uniref:IPT/TIG domain-containing protein n=1 Tax=Cryobacterium sp. PH29-G1 TaxID=3046211 RepID=UPI0024B88EE4|nr:IPT/TIG domain-containing protein [Cryobacterium sp. PH29-G1]MDJ0350033.1 IPT/TIG domain-containing protein [Cryobacterium sp. PH29-G1]